jgi:hypothetical protein
MTDPRRVDVPRSRVKVYLARAGALLKGVDWGLEESNPDVAAENAIHAGIAAADAFLIFHVGFRSSARSHHETLLLLVQTEAAPRGEVAHHLQRLLNRKNEVEYEDRSTSIGDAKELAKHARRLVELVRAEVGSYKPRGCSYVDPSCFGRDPTEYGVVIRW